MSGWLLVGLVLAWISLIAGVRADRPDEDSLATMASDLEKQGRWSAAAEVYWKLLRRQPMNPLARHRYLHCLRHLRLRDRHVDPVYRKQVRELTLSRSLHLYGEALSLIHSQYVDRVPVAVLFHLGLEELRLAFREEVFRREHAPDASTTQWDSLEDDLRAEWSDFTPESMEEARQAVRAIALSVQRSLGVRSSVVVMEFLSGACNGLDERSVFLTPRDESTQRVALLRSAGLILEPTAGEEGIVHRVVAESWAAQSGIKPGDRIRWIGPSDSREDANDLAAIEVCDPKMATPRRIKLPQPPSVVDEEFHMGGIGQFRITHFQTSTPAEVERVVSRFQMLGLRSLVIDLRGNPGGSLFAAIQLAERFLPTGTIVVTQGQMPAVNRTWESHSGSLAWDMPVIVLIDGETASAAEVFAGALKDHHRAKLVGSPTFGKGTVQRDWPIADQGLLRLTLARLYNANGLPYETTRVIPDIFEPVRAKEAALDLARAITPFP
jgi:carboxyl-terminal processing protease